ncbi:MAG: hypothetical protein FJZ49_00180 [Candidatus Verstraetearchaeota archaeon]|nr:hypothetical protein [Candidatus Verstraetearchaeota archaeon]
MPPKTPDRLSMMLFGISLLGLVLLAALTFSISVTLAILPQQRLLTGSVFVAICVLGMAAALYPSRCSGLLRFGRDQDERPHIKGADTGESGVRFAGHHPACGGFSSHVFRIGGKICCAGCTGLVAGAVASIAGSIIYLLAGFNMGGAGAPIFWAGFVGAACGLLPHSLLDLKRASVRLFLNFVLAFGAFLLLVGVNEITGNPVVAFFLLTLIVYWIYARMMLSRQEHRRICANCGLKECP